VKKDEPGAPGGDEGRADGPGPLQERLGFMLHVTCDGCGKGLRPGDDHHVLKIEVFASHDPAELTEADLDDDHMEAVAELLRQMEENNESVPIEPASCNRRYDLCTDCRKRFLRDPLGRETAQKFHFSKN
jgi:hypothetical protein